MYDLKEPEWYSQPELSAVARLVMGGKIDLDPFSSAEANEIVKADKFFTKEDDGFKQNWLPRVYAAPMGSLTKRFAKKLEEEFDAGRTRSAVVVLPLVCTYASSTLRDRAVSIFVPHTPLLFSPSESVPRCRHIGRFSKKPCLKSPGHKPPHSAKQKQLGGHAILLWGKEADPKVFEEAYSDVIGGTASRPSHIESTPGAYVDMLEDLGEQGYWTGRYDA